MRLKQIKLSGFKSFVDLTKVPFEHDMTAVVGPNGCGKSNIIDAVRWVLGESSAKNLRGDMMTDVIFNGAKHRKPVGVASVELFFENTLDKLQGQLANRNEISIRRTVNRDGVNQYFLNGSKCRRKDITDIFLGTGLGPRSYAIIEQGTISRLIESKPLELRIFIEEAAGVSKYKERRRETENSLRHTRDNLARVADIQTELDSQIEKLQQQAQAAEQFRQSKSKERHLKAQLAAFKWQHHQNQYQCLLDKTKHYQLTINELKQNIELADKTKQQGLSSLEEVVALLDSANEETLTISNQVTKVEQSVSYLEKSQQQLKQELSLLSLKEEQSGSQKQKSAAALSKSKIQLAELKPQYEAFKLSVVKKTDELTLSQQQLNQLVNQQHDHHKSAQHHLTKKSKLEQQLSGLTQQQQMLVQRQQKIETQLSDTDVSWLQQENEQQIVELQKTIQRQTELSASIEKQQKKKQHSADKLANIERETAEKQGQLSGCNHQLKHLNYATEKPDWQQKQAQILAEQNVQLKGHWAEQLNIPQLWQLAFESVAGYWLEAEYAREGVNLDKLADDMLLVFPDKAQMPKPGTLTQWLDNDTTCLPWLSDIYVADDVKKAQQLLISLNAGASVICPDGTWLGHGFLRKGKVFESSSTMLQQQQQISTLEVQQQQLTSQVVRLSTQKDDEKERLIKVENKLALLNNNLAETNESRLVYQQKIQANELAIEHRKSLNISLNNELQQIDQQLEENRQQLSDLSACFEDLEQQQYSSDVLELITSQIEQLQLDVENKQIDTRQQQENEHQLALTLSSLKQEITTTELKIEQQNTELIAAKSSILETKQKLTAIEAELDNLLSEKDCLVEKNEQQHKSLQDLIKQRQDIQQQIKSQDLDYQKDIQLLAKYEAKVNKIQLDMEGHQFKSDAALEQLQIKNYRLDDVIDELPSNISIDSWQRKIKQVSQQISELGAINLAAIDEYQSQVERQQYLQNQQQDLQRAISTLESVIATIDKETRQRFKATFDRVNEDVKSLFPKIFGGGSAYLTLTDDDLLETGVTIMARPPGKKNSTIHLLSGGEKALTALSLVFAIFRLNPAPFCMLDEVDAPLDDINVGRFCNLVREMSDTVQFVYISHNKIAIEMASHLTGVTMFEPGVSRMVAVDVDEAIAMAEVS